MSQAELAGAVGVSRQAIAGIESGSFDPSLRVALAIADALGATVEELFGEEASVPPPVEAMLVGGDANRRRADAAVAPAGLVAVPRHGDLGLALGFQAANARVLPEPASGPLARLLPARSSLPRLVLAGCDPALGLLVSVLAHHDPPVEVVWIHSTSTEALRLFERGLVSVAGYHQSEEEPLHTPRGALVIAFATWQEGLCGRAEEDGLSLLAHGARLVNRQVGSEARHLLDISLVRARIQPEVVAGYESEVRSHVQVASAVSAGLGDVGVTIEPVAIDFGLHFLPLARERFVLACAPGLAGQPELAAVLRACAGDELRAQFAALPGYLDIEGSGRPLAGAS
jgi:molybdate-binding protein/DNA-binding XRE family transcriptional regulator